jgi:glucose/arabinose dehydrogenase
LSVESWASGITSPWDIAFLPNGEALIPEKVSGVVYRRRNNGSVQAISMSQPDFTAPGEGGLMGLVVDPDFDQNRLFYTCQNSTRPDVRVIRWKLNGTRTKATRQSVIVDDIVMTSGRHSGCRLRFGYEGHLWITTGDAAVTSSSQSLSSLGGKVLRVDPQTGNGIASNPFYTSAGADRSKIYSYGHRNPQGLDRRPCTNQMWTGEHGPGWDDEINLLASGGNYGWNPGPGYNENAGPDVMTDFSLPGKQLAAKWSSDVPTIALSGVGWIRGSDWGGWDGELAGATLKNQQLWIFEFSNKNKLLDTDVPSELDNLRGRLRTAVMGPDGSLYVVSSDLNTIFRVTPASGPTPIAQDLNGDGFADLVVGAPRDNIGSRSNAGGFNVLYDGGTGISPQINGDDLRNQRNVHGAAAESGDRFGSSVAYGDVDGDGIADVVVGSPREGVSGSAQSGGVTLICGRTNGVQRRSSQTFTQAGSVAGAAEAGDHFGQAVALADFDGDGYDDLAVGAPDEGVAGRARAGAVTIMYGTPAGLTTENSKAFSQAGKVGGSLEAGDRFGSALAVGDFNGDGFADLAIGSPRETVKGRANAGAVTIMFGRADGLRSANSQYFTQSGKVPGDNGAGDRFGSVLAAGDFNNDGNDDLAIGIPNENLGGATNAGAVVILRGSNSGLTTNGSSIHSQAGAVPGSSETGDNFGSALAAGDFDNDGDDDLAVGSAGEDNNAGRVVTFNGSGGGLSFDASFAAGTSLPGSANAGQRRRSSRRHPPQRRLQWRWAHGPCGRRTQRGCWILGQRRRHHRVVGQWFGPDKLWCPRDPQGDRLCQRAHGDR